jgi:hypothetical protein
MALQSPAIHFWGTFGNVAYQQSQEWQPFRILTWAGGHPIDIGLTRRVLASYDPHYNTPLTWVIADYKQEADH